MTTDLATTKPQAISAPNASRDALNNLWSHAKMLSESSLVPQAYAGKPHNCVIAIELAARLGSSPLMIMQSLDIIQGRPSWSSKFLIATVNATGKFTPLRFEYEGKEGTKDWSCRAVACDINQKTGEVGQPLRGSKISMAMADAEGWLSKSGSKWKTMPEQMLAYRAAAFWTRIYCPEVSMGLHTSEEREDIIHMPSSRNNMPDDIKTALLSEGVAITVPEVVPANTAEPSAEDDGRA